MYSFYKNYFLVNLKDYPALGFDFPITAVLCCFVIALIFTTIVVNYKRRKIEEIISALTRHNAFSEDSAKTLSELNLNPKAFARILSFEGQLTKMVSRVGETKLSYEEFMALSKTKGIKEENPDIESSRFYINEESKARAQRVLEMGSTSLLNTILFCLFLVAVFFCLALLMPGILSVVNTLLGG